jgi:steroid 5-alpha reductase family enzyme
MTVFTQASIFSISAGLTLGIQLTGFAFAYALKTEVFYDILGGFNYLALAIFTGCVTPDFGPRSIISTTLFICSRSWLLLFLAWRAHERKGDSRFDEVKNKFGLFLVYWVVQAFWVFLISMPMIYVNTSTVDDSLEPYDYVLAAGFAFGIIIEILADVQKALWVNKGRAGGFCSVGVWKYSRHPNYFGEMLQWWCSWLFAYGSPGNRVLWGFCILSPLFTMHILVNVSGTGLTNCEGKSLKRYYDNFHDTYTEYRANTSILIPMIGYKFIPLFLKRTIFLDLKRYEYKPTDKQE